MGYDQARPPKAERREVAEYVIDGTATVLRGLRLVIQGALKGAWDGAVEAVSLEQDQWDDIKDLEDLANDPRAHKDI